MAFKISQAYTHIKIMTKGRCLGLGLRKTRERLLAESQKLNYQRCIEEIIDFKVPDLMI